jgi:outer membrane lipoprotein-sorting protein
MRKLLIASLMALVLTAPWALAEDERTLDSVAEQIEAVWEKVNSYTAAIAINGNIPMGPLAVTTSANGTIEYMSIDETPRFRMEILNKLGSNVPLLGDGMEQKVLTVFNGEIIYSEMEAMGRKQYSKAAPKEDDSQSPVGGKNLIDTIRKRGEVTLLPDETVNGVDSYAIEVKPDNGGQQQGPIKAELIRFFVAKDSGIQVRSILMDAEGNALLTTDYTDIKVNPEIDPERFNYAPPAGVEVIDMGDGTKRPKLFQ